MAEATTSVLMAGVGGQGIILASQALAGAAAAAGLDVKKSDVHGMAQRGGSVTSHVRFGPKVYSPLIPDGEADVLLGSEPLEGLRWLPMLREGGRVMLNTHRIAPPAVLQGEAMYPGGVEEAMRARDPRCVAFDALEEAKALGEPRAATVVLLGSLSTMLPFEAEVWKAVLQKVIPPKVVEVNLRAFDRGVELAGG